MVKHYCATSSGAISLWPTLKTANPDDPPHSFEQSLFFCWNKASQSLILFCCFSFLFFFFKWIAILVQPCSMKNFYQIVDIIVHGMWNQIINNSTQSQEIWSLYAASSQRMCASSNGSTVCFLLKDQAMGLQFWVFQLYSTIVHVIK